MTIVKKHLGESGDIRIVLDTNVFISAVVFGGVPGEILDLGRYGRILFGISDPIIDEITFFLEKLYGFTERVELQKKVNIPVLDKNDKIIVETGINFSAEAIVSGDQDLLSLQLYDGIPILTPRNFLDKFDS